MNETEIIQNALNAVKTIQDLFLEKLRASDDSNVQKFLKELVSNCLDQSQDISALASLGTQFVEEIVGPHKRQMRELQHQHLSSLATLSLDGYCDYCDGLEKLSMDFMGEVNTLIQEQTAAFLPQLIEKSLSNLLPEESSDSDEPSFRIGSDGWLP